MGDTLGVRVSKQAKESLRDLANLYYKLGLIPYPRVGLLIEMFGVRLLKGYLEKYIEELEKERGLK
jgi:hypothetical protein